MSKLDLTDLKQKFHSETAQISWAELQRFYAQGNVVHINESLDLIEVAAWFAEDLADKIKPHLEVGTIAKPDNKQAQSWFDENTQLWSVVVAPFVLVQKDQSDK